MSAEYDLKDSTIIIADDEPHNVLLLRRLLERAGYANLRTTTSAHEVFDLVKNEDPDLLILDLHMPRHTGLVILAELARVLPPDTYVPTLVVTGDVSPGARHRALLLGAHDYLTKPLDATEALHRIYNLLHTRRLTRELQHKNELLEQSIQERAHALRG